MLIYVAGPYRAASAWAIELNVRVAEFAALEVWRLGHVAVCPHAMTRYYQGALPDDVWLEGLLELMRRCDAVLMVGDWRSSTGSVAERTEAERLGLPVFEYLGDVPEGKR